METTPEGLVGEGGGFELSLQHRAGIRPGRQNGISDYGKGRLNREEEREKEKENVAEDRDSPAAPTAASHLGAPGPILGLPWPETSNPEAENKSAVPAVSRAGLVPANFCCLHNHKVKHLFPVFA